MNKSEIIQELKQFFRIEELVCPHTYKRFGDRSWSFLDERLLHALLILRRDLLKVPLTINTYHLQGGAVTQRGLRCNVCQIVKDKSVKDAVYLSSHIFGKAVDIVSNKMTAHEMREIIKANLDKFPFPIRIEKDVSWLHIDVTDEMKGKLVEFNG